MGQCWLALTTMSNLNPSYIEMLWVELVLGFDNCLKPQAEVLALFEGWVCGVDKLRIKLSQLPTKLELELKLSLAITYSTQKYHLWFSECLKPGGNAPYVQWTRTPDRTLWYFQHVHLSSLAEGLFVSFTIKRRIWGLIRSLKGKLLKFLVSCLVHNITWIPDLYLVPYLSFQIVDRSTSTQDRWIP